MYKFEKLIVWQKSLELVRNVYLFSESINDHSLKDQIRRSVTSVPLNIAEGSGSQNDKEFKRYLYIARKSLFETLGCLKIAGFLFKKENSKIEDQINEVGKLLNGLINKVKSNS
ncbi:four helix bundle protein [Candidatus Roizmanbacteria bacterium]|nr:MAG: four helix bundle protein [Candidatus Roizmanbacteria bacterium]